VVNKSVARLKLPKSIMAYVIYNRSFTEDTSSAGKLSDYGVETLLHDIMGRFSPLTRMSKNKLLFKEIRIT